LTTAKLNPKYAEAINKVGAADYLQKNYGRAACYFKKALALQEANASYHANLGAAWFAEQTRPRNHRVYEGCGTVWSA
jgi:tetratricopeptide (TPR) repeat protein